MDAATVGKTLSELGSQPSYCSWGDNRRVLWRLCQNVLVFCGVREWSSGRGLYLRRTYTAIVRRAQCDFGSPAIVPSEKYRAGHTVCPRAAADGPVAGMKLRGWSSRNIQ